MGAHGLGEVCGYTRVGVRCVGAHGWGSGAWVRMGGGQVHGCTRVGVRCVGAHGWGSGAWVRMGGGQVRGCIHMWVRREGVAGCGAWVQQGMGKARGFGRVRIQVHPITTRYAGAAAGRVGLSGDDPSQPRGLAPPWGLFRRNSLI